MDNLPAIGGTAAGAVIVLIALIRFLLTEPSKSLQEEVKGLRGELTAEREARRTDVAAVNHKLAALEALYDDSRKEKHRLNNELTKAQVLLGVIIDLADKCTCHALDIVQDLLRRSVPIQPLEDP